MVKKFAAGFAAAAGVCLTIILISQENWLILCFWGVFLTAMVFLWLWRREAYMKELGDISGCLDDLLRKRNSGQKTVAEETVGDDGAETGGDEKQDFLYSPAIYDGAGTDTLAGKIFFQIQRAEQMYSGTESLLEKERDGIRRLLAELAHQLRTPLANLETYFALLEDDGIGEEDKKAYLGAMEQSEKKLSFLIEKFIVAARLENRIIQIRKSDTDLKETVAQAVFQVYKKADEKNINIVVQEQRLEKKVPHDRNWLCEAVYNLLDNSIKYSPGGSGITVTLSSDDMFAEIRVEDSGTGIEEEEKNQIFQLYYRGKNVSGQEGYGMGLFITREIVLKHDGFIKVKRKKKGLIFSIILPRAV